MAVGQASCCAATCAVRQACRVKGCCLADAAGRLALRQRALRRAPQQLPRAPPPAKRAGCVRRGGCGSQATRRRGAGHAGPGLKTDPATCAVPAERPHLGSCLRQHAQGGRLVVRLAARLITIRCKDRVGHVQGSRVGQRFPRTGSPCSATACDPWPYPVRCAKQAAPAAPV